MHRRLHARADRPKSSQAHQVERFGSQRGHHSGAVAPLAVGILIGLAIADPVPTFNSPAVANQLQQHLWGGAQAGEEQVLRLKGLAVAPGGGRDFHDPVGVDPGLQDVLLRLFGTQGPGDGAAVADLVIRCHELILRFP